jgi:hypothetical protein
MPLVLPCVGVQSRRGSRRSVDRGKYGPGIRSSNGFYGMDDGMDGT